MFSIGASQMAITSARLPKMAAAVPATGTSPLPPGPRPCFDVPAEGEIVVHGRKLVGSAQRRFGSAVLQHGSILLGPAHLGLASLLALVRRAAA